MADLIPLSEFRDPSPAPKGVDKPESTDSDLIPLEEFRNAGGAPQKDFVEKTLSGMKSLGGNSAALADMILGAPWFAISFGANLGNQATGLAFNNEDLKTAAKSGRKVQEDVMNQFGNPLHQLMQLFHTDQIYDESATAEGMGKVAGWIKAAGDWTEKVTRGAVPSEEVETMADGLMLLGGAKGGDLVKRLWEQRKAAGPDYVPKEVSPEQTVEQGPKQTAQQDINEMLNIRSTRDRRAYEQKRRREVREAFNNDSDYADYLKFAADERVRNHDAWTKGAREQEQREQAARASEDPAVPKPAEPAPGQIGEILAKPGFQRTADDLIALRRYNEKQGGYVKPELLARLATVGLGVGAGGLWLDSEDPTQGMLLGGVAGLALGGMMTGPGKVPAPTSVRARQAGAVKGPGGMWHPEAVERLSSPLRDTLVPGGEAAAYELQNPGKLLPQDEWANKAIRNYLNKYAGTERDPLKDIEVPFGEGTKRWEELWDKSIKAVPNEKYPGESTFNFDRIGEQVPAHDIDVPAGDRAVRETSSHITGYLSHVGDYLRQNVKPEELGRYDLVRAVRETAANDARVAKEMEKAATASTKDLPVYKDYGDGMKWVELKLPAKLTPEQVKTVRPMTEAERRAYRNDTGNAGSDFDMNRGDWHVALGPDGKPIKNSYTGDIAVAPSAAEAHLAGQLAQEGNQMGHCVGGYCAGVASGESRIFSLRDAKGRSHVTVETSNFVDPRDFYEQLPEHLKEKFGPNPQDSVPRGQSQGPHVADSFSRWADNVRDSREYKEFVKSRPETIDQIKGKQNRAPNAEYLPYVQDFVKSGKWGEVGDLSNTGMFELSKTLQDKYKLGRYVTQAELDAKPELNELHSSRNLNRSDLGDRRLLEERQPGPRGWQEGSIDIGTAAKLAGLAGGAAIGGAYADNRVMGAILGGLGGLTLMGASPRGVAAVFKRAWAPDTRLRINDLANSWEHKTEAAARGVFQMQTRMEQLLPKEADRIAVTNAIDAGDTSKLSPRQQDAARLAQSYFARMADVGQEAGVLKDAIANYVTHLWKQGPQSAGIIDEIFGRRGGANMSPETKFALRRSVPTIAEGKAKGLVPKTEDISAIMGVYGNSLNRAMANRELITSLKNEKVPGTEQGLVLKDREAPASYVRIDHPQLAGMRVHPDIVPSLKFIFDNHQPGVVMRGLEGLNMLSKRLAVSFSLFHAKALADAFIGAATNPLKVGKHIAQSIAPKVFGENEYLKQLRTGGAGDLVDKAQQAGLKFSMGRDSAGVEDVRGNFYTAMKDLQRGLDGAVQGLGLPVKGFIQANHLMDKFMWDRLHAGMKLSTFAEKYATLLENNAKAHEKNPMVPMRPKEQLAEMAAAFTNDVFGGLNWRRIAESASTRWGREAALNLLSPAGRRVSQLLLFAPDWTLSTARAAYKAFNTGGTGPRGLIEPKTVTDLHRQYLVRSALYYLAVGDAINLSMSGHHLWDNQDPTTIDMGDGRKMQWSKHTMESVHWLTKPRQQALNKLGIIPREIANQSLGTEYLSAYGKAPPMKSRFEHALRGFSPIAVQQNFDAGAGSGIAGFLGTPIYGKTFAERQALKEQRRMNQRMSPRMPK